MEMTRMPTKTPRVMEVWICRVVCKSCDFTDFAASVIWNCHRGELVMLISFFSRSA